MSVLVFGGTGLIGSHLVRALVARGDHVTVASRRRAGRESIDAQWVQCDVRQPDGVQYAFAVARPRRVVHLAAALQFACNDDPSLASRTNVAGTTNVLESARIACVERMILGSSVAVYGERNDVMREDDTPGPSLSIYGAAKRFEERLGAEVARRWGMQFAALRFCAVFGAGGSEGYGMSRVRSKIASMRSGIDVEIREACGQEAAQLTYVDDAVGAILGALDVPSLPRTEYNVAGPPENYMSLRDYGCCIAALFPRSGRLTFSGRGPSLGPVDTSRIKEDLNWTARVPVMDGLRHMFGTDPDTQVTGRT